MPRFDEVEKLVLESVLRQVRRMLPELEKWFAAEQRIPDFLITWPSQPVVGDDGSIIDNLCLMPFLETASEEVKKKAIKNAALKTKAYAVLVCRSLKEKMWLVFETEHGTHSWDIPIVRSGDVRLLSKAVEHEGRDKLNVLLP